MQAELESLGQEDLLRPWFTSLGMVLGEQIRATHRKGVSDSSPQRPCTLYSSISFPWPSSAVDAGTRKTQILQHGARTQQVPPSILGAALLWAHWQAHSELGESVLFWPLNPCKGASRPFLSWSRCHGTERQHKQHQLHPKPP